MDISEHIYQFKASRADFSTFQTLKNFFSVFPLNEEKSWPLACLKTAPKLEYTKAKIVQDPFGFEPSLDLVSCLRVENANYILDQQIKYDDVLEIEIRSLVREGQKTTNGVRFVHDMLNQYHSFLKNFSRAKDTDERNCLLKIEAHSGMLKGIRTNGGYVWATCRFEFKDKIELDRVRRDFQRYAATNGVKIKTSDLRFFKYPCHFAAFRCHQKVNSQDLGKAFLLQYSWQGNMSAALKDTSEIVRYEQTFYEKGILAAEKELSVSFLRTMKKYNKPNSSRARFLELFVERKNTWNR